MKSPHQRNCSSCVRRPRRSIKDGGILDIRYNRKSIVNFKISQIQRSKFALFRILYIEKCL
jgi:hypothetical protein